MNPSTRATVAAAASVAIAAAGMYGARWLAVAVLATVFVLALGWPALTWTPHWITGSIIVLGSGALSTVAVLLGRDEPYLRHMVVALSIAVVAALVVEVLRPSPPGQVVTAVASTVSGAAVAASAAAWIAVARTPGAEDLVVVGAAALAVAAVASTLSSNMAFNVSLALLLAAGVGAGAGYVFSSLPWYGGMFVGILSACAFITVHELTRRDTENQSVLAAIASGIVPVTVAGTLVYIGGRIVVG